MVGYATDESETTLAVRYNVRSRGGIACSYTEQQLQREYHLRLGPSVSWFFDPLHRAGWSDDFPVKGMNSMNLPTACFFGHLNEV